MTLEFTKKYMIVKSIIDNFKENPFTIGELYVLSDGVAKEYHLSITPLEVVNIVVDLYDNFEIDKLVGKDNVIRYVNAETLKRN